MAIFTPGPTVAAVSGSIGGTTYSRNRGGAYMRRRAIPSNPSTIYQEAQRARIALYSQQFAALTGAQQLQWQAWALQNQLTNSLGSQISMSAHQSYVRLNTRLNAAGDAAISAPPVGAAPAGLTSLSATGDIGAGAFALTFAATPLGADDRLVVDAAVVNSLGIHYVANLFKQVVVSAKAQATGLDTKSDIEARFGTLIVGQVVYFRCAVHDSVTGLRSLPLSTLVVVSST